MSDQYVAEIRMVGFNFPPTGWAFCNGQLLSISQNTALFSLLGTTYGGDGKSTFGLPNLQAAAPIGMGQGPGLTFRNMGDNGGEAAVTLLTIQMPAHNHNANCISGGGSTNSVANDVWAATGGRGAPPLYAAAATPVSMNAGALQNTGSNQPHNNLPPFLGVYFVIALQGIYPPRN